MAIKKKQAERPPSIEDFAVQVPYASPLSALSRARDVEWEKRHANDHEVPVGERLIFASEASKCARKIAYRLAGEQGEEFDDVGRHVTEIGNAIHEAIQADWPKDQQEVSFRLSDADGLELVAGRADMTEADAVWDLKSIASFGFKLKHQDGTPEPEHVLQIGLGMLALGKSRGVLVYVAKEKLSNPDTKRFGLEADDPSRVVMRFEFTMDDILPFVERELIRLQEIRRRTAEHGPDAVPRAVPNLSPRGARMNPHDSSWVVYEGNTPNPVAQGQIWRGQFCNYCAFQAQCIESFDREKAEALAAREAERKPQDYELHEDPWDKSEQATTGARFDDVGETGYEI